MSAKATILVVDDDPDVVEQLTVTLAGQGFRVIAASGREQAEETLLAVRPDLAIVDLMMERLDSGFVLAHHLRDLYPDTPVILLTAVTATTGLSFDAQHPDARSWLGACRVLNKPVRAEQLKAEVARLLHRARPPGTGGKGAAAHGP